ncbi:MAG TPA: hypothetical protein VN040_06535 [Pseudosphingobacterium sp.]|nr:hypothetical protein [Pseudosphingobacterium sp.]
MESLNIEITENQYLIRLKKSDFDLNYLYSLLRTLGADTPVSKTEFFKQEDDDMIKSWKNSVELGERFDHLLDK